MSTNETTIEATPEEEEEEADGYWSQRFLVARLRARAASWRRTYAYNRKKRGVHRPLSSAADELEYWARCLENTGELPPEGVG
jgi:hypothetical protein